MSAIYGIIRHGGRDVSEKELRQVSFALAHRGPRAAHWSGGSASFGSIEQTEAVSGSAIGLPTVERDGELVAVCDSRLDNRGELIDRLNLEVASDRALSDGQIVLHAFRKWGLGCAAELLGDFAFAIWNERSRELYCARDHFGVRPFYYHAGSNLFAFASEPKALLQVTGIGGDPDDEQLVLFLAGMEENRSSTSYRSIQRLPARHLLMHRDRATRTESYYHLDPEPTTRFRRGREYGEAFREVFTNAVKARLIPENESACLLSGGLDSSSICCVARGLALEAMREPVRTFSQVYSENSECDERGYMNSVVQLGHFAPTFVHANPVKAREEIAAALSEQGELFSAPGMIANGNLRDEVRKAGCSVLLTGHGGDEVASMGFGYLRELAENNRWMRLGLECLPNVIRRQPGALQTALSYLTGFGTLGKLRRRVRLRSRFSFQGRTFSEETSPADAFPRWCTHMNPAVVREYSLLERRVEWRKQRFQAAKSERAAHFQLLDDVCHQTTFEVLDRAHSRWGIQLVCPFWDKRVVEFCLSLPSDQKMSFGTDRVSLRRAMKGILPEIVRTRLSKTNFMPNLRDALCAGGAKEWQDFIDFIEPVGGRFLNVAWMRNAATSICEGGNTAAWDIMNLLSSATLGIWLTGKTSSPSFA